MSTEMSKERIERLIQIGSIMEGIGINTIELAEKLKEHVEGCPGGRGCVERLIAAAKEEK
jgi:hypothetical protein